MEDLTSIQLVEEENEESNVDAEIAIFDMVGQSISSSVNGFQDYAANHFQEFHAQKKYMKVYISVPYSPPDWS